MSERTDAEWRGDLAAFECLSVMDQGIVLGNLAASGALREGMQGLARSAERKGGAR